MKRARWRTIASRAAIALGLLVLAMLVATKLLYGRGAPYPDVSTAPSLPAGALTPLVTLDLPPGNVTRSKGGRIFFNTHPFARSDRFVRAFVFELVGGVPKPYPDEATQHDLEFAFGMTVDAQDRLWLTSPATLDRARTRIQAFDLATGARVFDRELEPGVGRFAQDLRVAKDGRTLFLADTGAFHFTHGALLVVDVATGQARTVLANDPSTEAKDYVIRARGGAYRVGYGLLTFAAGADGLALSRDGAYLYYAAMSHDTLYRVPTDALRDPGLSEADLARRVETVGKKPLSDGIEVAPDGSVLVTDIENGAIAQLDAHGALRTLVRSDAIVWADGVTVSDDGEVLFTDSAIPAYLDPLMRPPSRERLEAGRPYHIYRFAMP